MNTQEGHISASAERGREFGNILGQYTDGQARLRREFSRTIGQRTFRIIRFLGVVEKTTFMRDEGNFHLAPFNTVITSKPLEFQLPGSQTDYGLRFELDSMAQAIRLPWIRPLFTFGVAAELSTDTQKSRAHISSSEYEGDKGIEMSVAGFKLTHDGPNDTGKAEVFNNVLTFAEAVIEGSTPHNLPDSLKLRD
jgi:hypothetical protein